MTIVVPLVLVALFSGTFSVCTSVVFTLFWYQFNGQSSAEAQVALPSE
jgi:hypothetical protein